MLLNGSIHICGRSDGDPGRIFDGSVAHLALFGSMLTDDQISTLYQAYTTGADPEPGLPSWCMRATAWSQVWVVYVCRFAMRGMQSTNLRPSMDY